MNRLQSFIFELEPNGAQKFDMRKIVGCCRYVFNKALALQKENHSSGNKFIHYPAMANMLTQWRNDVETEWLKKAPCHPLQHALRNLTKAYQNFFEGRAEFPRFKKKGDRGSFRYPDSKQFKLDEVNNRIFLPKLGWMKYRNSRKVIGELRNITISTDGEKWFMSIQTQLEIEQPVIKSISAIGIDVGIIRFATMSDGGFIEPLDGFKKQQARLKKYQKRMSRKIKFSSNWKKEKAKVRRVHTKIKNSRKDFLHKTTTGISKKHALVCIEDLQVKKMSRSIVGTIENPGKGVQQKSKLNQSILDQGWGLFRSQLEYKLGWNGGMLLVVPPQYTSTSCPQCEHIAKENRKKQSLFKCMSCAYENHADVVGAINILERGHRLLACGEMMHVGRSMKQEPAEVSQLAFS